MPPELGWRGAEPPQYAAVLAWRQRQLVSIQNSPKLALGAFEYYRTRPVEFVNHWCVTYDPRNPSRGLPATVPFVMFPRQAELVEFLVALVDGEQDGLIEKARDMGATWVACGLSVWLWLFRPGISVGWGSRKEALVDRLGDADSIFEKMRVILRNLPPAFRPAGFKESEHATHMRIVNPVNGSTITGEAGDNIGRGGRKTIYFKDEAAHYERPEKIEAALGDNTRVQVDISSVNGPGNVFHRRREAGREWKRGNPVFAGVNVFVMDWSDHPAKTRAWYEDRKAKAEAAGLLHVFAQEVDRNYAAAVRNTLIKVEWIKSAIDAHKAIPGMDDGPWCAALDVGGGDSDGNLGDRNAWGARKGVVLRKAQSWGDLDPGVTARTAVDLCRDLGRVAMQYDCIGVGAAVKAEANRLTAEGMMPDRLEFVPWEAGAAPLNPDGRVVEDDAESPINKDFFQNLKAQGWWSLARRLEKTHKVITEGANYPVDELISISADIAELRDLEKELCQPVRTQSGRLKMMIDKTPPGTKSPNLGDMVMMLFHPVDVHRYTLDNL